MVHIIKTIRKEQGRSGKLTLSGRIYQLASKAQNKFFPYNPSCGRYNLSISHDKKFIWFRVAKVGTRTIFTVLESSNIILDAEHPMNCYYPTSIYKDYFKFAFVRNPWDRLVSSWHNKVLDFNKLGFSSEQLSEMKEFPNFVDYVSRLDIENCNHHLRLQTKLIDLNEIDFIGRFENFEHDLRYVTECFNLDVKRIPHKNVSKRKTDYRKYYDDDLIEKVANIYKRDINHFQYKF